MEADQGWCEVNAIDCLQGTQEWMEARVGKITASRVADACSFLKRGDKKGESSAGREAYKAELVAEILSGRTAEHYVSSYMERGTELEPKARTAYEIRYNVMVETVGFVIHPTITRSGASPDGIMSHKGVEFKCPKIDTHLKWMMAGICPPEHLPQVDYNMASCELGEWDFVSFCPELPERYQLFRVPVIRNEERIAFLESGTLQCLEEVDAMLANLARINPELAPIRPKSKYVRDMEASLSEALLTDEEIDRYLV